MELNTKRVDFEAENILASERYRADVSDITTNSERIFVPLDGGGELRIGKEALRDIIEATPERWMPDGK